MKFLCTSAAGWWPLNPEMCDTRWRFVWPYMHFQLSTKVHNFSWPSSEQNFTIMYEQKAPHLGDCHEMSINLPTFQSLLILHSFGVILLSSFQNTSHQILVTLGEPENGPEHDVGAWIIREEKLAGVSRKALTTLPCGRPIVETGLSWPTIWPGSEKPQVGGARAF